MITKHNRLSVPAWCRGLLFGGLCLMVCAPLRGAGDVVLHYPDSSRLDLSYTLSLPAVGSDYRLVATPLVCGPTDTLALSPVVRQGKRYTRKQQRAAYFTGRPVFPQSETGGVGGHVSLSTAQYPWLLRGPVSLVLRREVDGCCRSDLLPDTLLAHTAYVPPYVPVVPPVPDNTGRAGQLAADNPVLHHVSDCRDYTPDRVLRKERGALYVHFQLDKVDLLHDFRDNAATLDKIVAITRDIFADTTSRVVRIQVIGLASPEGAVKRNLWLGRERANALKTYIQRQVPQAVDELFDVVNGGEAWNELRDQIADSSIPYRDEMLQIIDSEADVDRRERLLKRLDGGRAYRYLRDNVLSDQRNSGYISICYDYKADVAARTVNDAISLIGFRRYDEALALLRTVEADPRSLNALGVVLWLKGQRAEARRVMQRAVANGSDDAAQNLRRWDAIERAEKNR